MRRLNEERGFTIIEMMVAVAILLGGALATLSMLDTAGKRTRSAADRQKATALAREVVEGAKAIPYRQIAPATLVELLRADAGLAGSSGSPWRVERDGTAFTLQAQVCWVDEPADGLGSKADGGFCTGSQAGANDASPIDLKQVTVSVSWRNGSGRGNVRQSTLIPGRHGPDAPAVQSVRLSSPINPLITNPAVTSAAFVVTTVTRAAAVVWQVDGAQQGTATGAEREWTFTWQLPPQDGTYLVDAQTVEPSGLVGEPGSVTVVLNRFLPVAPEDFTAARTEGAVEAKWRGSRERDVVGYVVYRSRGGQAVVACPFTTETACVDPAPPSPHGGLEYWVVAIERVGTTEREGAPSQRVDVDPPPESGSEVTP